MPLIDATYNVETTPRLLGLPDLPAMRRVLVAKLKPLPRDRLTPLHLAAEKGHTEMVELLLENGADPRAVDSDGRRPYDVVRRFICLCFVFFFHNSRNARPAFHCCH